MVPSRMITMEITHASTGRSMKKRASMTASNSDKETRRQGATTSRRSPRGASLVRVSPCLRVSLSPCLDTWHVHELRLDGDARPDLLQAVDDHPLAGLQALLDDP